ncbi:hypothetical protein C8N25_12168 [Algoriphagus antarcticus]|uniref:Uncharacterized protein n=1 Tax=Algoriphagus antarcticus TaxID=238540 RepID=A0A3E0DIJ0_9BACT|nr:hypothetical protein C8N25_12168 [Algoriphagus antarcticus]
MESKKILQIGQIACLVGGELWTRKALVEIVGSVSPLLLQLSGDKSDLTYSLRFQ